VKSPATKTAKSRLKEYCDQKWKGLEVTYSTEHIGQEFKATVTLPDKQSITGPAKPNKSKAENSVAEMMLSRLSI